jgi:acyl-CoA synthetase (AMP-forming)/AMP-acid ligase II/thioesterase domain-containing protein
MKIDSESFMAVEKSAAPIAGAAVETQLTLGRTIRENAILHPDHTAIVSAHFPPLRYCDLQLQLDQIRTQLRQGGFACGARIGILLPSGPEAVLAIVAVACSAVAIPLDPRQTPAELKRSLEALRLDALLVLRGSIPESCCSVEQRNLTIIEVAPAEDGKLGLVLNIPVSASPVPDSEPPPGAPAFILPTSGTTAQPKLIPFSHGNMLAAAARLKAWFDLTPLDRCLSISPAFYSHGLKVTVFTPLLTGGSIAVPASAAAVDLPEWFDGLRPTWYSAGPALHRAVLDQAKATANVQAMHTLRFAISGGAPLPGDVREELQRVLGVPVLEHYGSSEAAQIAANLPPPGPNRPGTCGRPWPEIVKIVGEDGSKLPPGEQGEVWVRGPTLFSGYLDAPDLNRDAFVNGWFRTGDLGSLDSEGFLSLHGRLSEVINRGGEKIAPAEIDSALLCHPAVAEAAAFAVPHPRLGADVSAAVVLRPGASVTSVDLRRFLQSKLTSFKIPRRIEIRDQLPKGVTGKVQRRQLTEIFVADASEPAKSLASVSAPSRLKLETELLSLWRRLLGSETLTIDDSFFESGGDSLLATEMLIEVERLVGHRVAESIMFEADTIRKFALRITAPSSSVTKFYENGDRLPLFFFHGDFSNGGLFLRRLVSLLGPDQPIIIIDPHGMRGDPIPSSIEEMAAARLPLILESQASGPFLLGGHCNGALVAFETARLLTAAGHKVELVAMIDPPTVCAHPVMRTIFKLMRHVMSPRKLALFYDEMTRLERNRNILMAQVLSKTLTKMRRLLNRNNRQISNPELTEAYTMAMARYLPAPLDVPVAFYAAIYNGQTWRHLCPNLEVVKISGGHHDCVVTGAEFLAMHLRQRIDTRFSETVQLRSVGI